MSLPTMNNDSVVSLKGTLNATNEITLYTVPSGRVLVITDWFVNNTSGTSVPLSVKFGGVPQLSSEYAPRNAKYIESDLSLMLVAGDEIKIKSGTSGAISYCISAIEQDAVLYNQGGIHSNFPNFTNLCTKLMYDELVNRVEKLEARSV